MKRNRKQNIKLLILVLFLLLGIGYAALTAELKVDGTVNVSKSTWDVHFENVQITSGSVSANPAPTTNNTDTTSMTYTINFTKPGDFYEFTVDVVNDGTIDAMVDVVSNKTYNSTGTTEIALPTYLTSTTTYNDGSPISQNHKLLKETSEKIKVRVEFKKDIQASDLPSSGDTTVVFKFKGDFKQADENAQNKTIVLPTGRTKNNLQLGDEICAKDQCFNFIRYDGEDIVMLAKYNLNVGDNPKGTETFLQDRDVIGNDYSNNAYGMVAFTIPEYWINTSDMTLKSEYGTSYPTDIYDSQYITAPNFNNMGYETEGYSIAYYVEQYKTKLTTDYHLTIKNARLLTHNEATNVIGCTDDNQKCPTNSFVTNTNFWLGSIADLCNVYFISNSNVFGYEYPNLVDVLGVRPVIVITKSNI